MFDASREDILRIGIEVRAELGVMAAELGVMAWHGRIAECPLLQQNDSSDDLPFCWKIVPSSVL